MRNLKSAEKFFSLLLDIKNLKEKFSVRLAR